MSGAGAHECESARQYAAVGKCRQQLCVALAARETRIEQIVDGAAGALGERSDAFPVAPKAHLVRGNVGGGAGPQSQRQCAVALTPALDLAAQKMDAQPSTDAGQAHAMDMRVGAQSPSQARRRVVEPLS